MLQGTHATTTTVSAEPWLERGHFEGRQGIHIDARLRKEAALGNLRSLVTLLGAMAPVVERHFPSVLIGQQAGAAKVATLLGRTMGVPSVSIPKYAVPAALFDETELSRPLLIEDNVVTGRNLRLALDELAGIGIEPIAAVSLFDSDGSDLRSFGLPVEAVYDLGITSWQQDHCELCRTIGRHTLGQARLEATS